jgi:hypothetical protein
VQVAHEKCVDFGEHWEGKNISELSRSARDFGKDFCPLLTNIRLVCWTGFYLPTLLEE